jgi:glycosyltransferase involved in cell wall biosynthesis
MTNIISDSYLMPARLENALESSVYDSDASYPSVGIVIATYNRPEPLSTCLSSINAQSILPGESIIVDCSEGCETRDMIDGLRGSLQYECRYLRSAVASAAEQRNLGAEIVSSDLILFLDDDVILEPDFVHGIVKAFQSRVDGRLAGVSGTITNQVYSDPKRLNRLLLGLCLGQFSGSFAGKVLGPAINFLPADVGQTIQEVEWLPTTCTAYRRDVFLENRFETTFHGYSFAEDVHLSTRIAQKYVLANTTKARAFHSDLGKDTHRNWSALGESQVKNRHLIMTAVLGRNRFVDHLRLFCYEMIYCPIALLAAGASDGRWEKLVSLLRGKIRGFWKIWTCPAIVR